MSSGFAFVPRKVAKASKPKISLKDEPSGPQRAHVSIPAVDDKGKGREVMSETLDVATVPKSQYSDEDYATLFCLSLSRHRLWSNPDLRRAIELSSSNDGFFPLSSILESTSPLSAVRASETAIVKALRTHATDIVDVRMTIPSDGPIKARGNFEIRPKFWADAGYPVSREGWDSRTVYVENIPVKCKTIIALCRFILALLPASSSVASYNRIQGVSLPARHTSDDPSAEPRLKSFALLTFADPGDVETLLTAWPWVRRQSRTEDTPDASEAVKFGFRALSKARWEDLNAQYLRYRAQLLAEINDVEESAAPPPEPSGLTHPEPQRSAPPGKQPALTEDSPYPPNCLVFVRHIHPETNKTTLRNFFAKAVRVKEAIDYVDFNKGMDSCYVRLTTAPHARDFVDHFADNRTVQASGLDDASCPSNAQVDGKHVEAELVVGKREELYWEKVPEKVRLLAVQKALGIQAGDEDGDKDQAGAGEGRRRQRKKQKR